MDMVTMGIAQWLDLPTNSLEYQVEELDSSLSNLINQGIIDAVAKLDSETLLQGVDLSKVAVLTADDGLILAAAQKADFHESIMVMAYKVAADTQAHTHIQAAVLQESGSSFYDQAFVKQEKGAVLLTAHYSQNNIDYAVQSLFLLHSSVLWVLTHTTPEAEHTALEPRLQDLLWELAHKIESH